MIVRPARAADFDELVRITSAARVYLAEQGSDQWGGGWPTPARIREDVRCGYALLAADEASGAVLGTVSFVGAGEPDYARLTSGFWLTSSPNSWDDGEVTYAVLHRLAVAPEARRRGVALFLLRSCLELARERGFASVRVDTHHKNLPMQSAFEKAGFARCCELVISSPYEPTKERVGFEALLG
jgi:ribosomal protein S18 acetylase RimI-like enzyme